MALWLVIVYIILVAVGVAVSYFIGWAVDQYNDTLGLLVFLGLVAFTLFLSWKIAVRLTEPKDSPSPS